MSIEKANEFLASHQMRAEDFDLNELVEIFTDHMNKGLTKTPASLMMLPTYIEAENEFQMEKPVIAIDAGGTNFRTAIVYFNKQRELIIDQLKNYSMPGVEKEISKEEFFDEMASYLDGYAEQSGQIGFCFSYATEIFPNKDGKLIQFSKEVKAKEVVGEMIGENLLKALGTPEKQIVILNDTVATLLAGKSAATQKTYDSFIGYILGTGTNTCYIEKNSNILKADGLDQSKSQIINIESGNFNNAPRTDIDITFDNGTGNPGNYSFEKMFSGGYFGGLCLKTLQTAAKEGLFTEATSVILRGVDALTSEQANSFTLGIADANNPLKAAAATGEDADTIMAIIDGLIERAAKLVAGNIAAVILKTEKGQQADKPVLLTIEGTTFYKLKGLRIQFENYLQDYLSGDKQRYYEIVEVDQSSLVGAALAALVN